MNGLPGQLQCLSCPTLRYVMLACQIMLLLIISIYAFTSLLNNIPGMTFTKDAKTGVYLACNQAFAEYAHKESPDGVVEYTDAHLSKPVEADHMLRIMKELVYEADNE